MSELVTAIPTGVAAFTATNLDDLVILTLFFSQVNETFRRRHIVFGQYLGFTTLVVASLPAFFGSLLLPRCWVGLLGLIPIAVGLSRLLHSEEDVSEEVEQEPQSTPSFLASLLSPQTCSVAAVTIANGSDNIGIYVPLFASSAFDGLLAILSVFFSLVGVWCYATYQLTRQPVIANVLTRYGNNLAPFVLIGLGTFIVLESSALSPLALIISCLCMICLFKISWRPEVEES